MNDRPVRHYPPSIPGGERRVPIPRRPVLAQQEAATHPAREAAPHQRQEVPAAPSADPEKLYYGWIIVACAFATLAIGVNARTAFSLLYPEILAEFGWSRGETAGAFAMGFVFAAGMGPLVGLSLNRFGPRIVMPVGSVMMALGLVGTTFISAPWMLYVTFGVLVVGASTILGYIGHAATLPMWFQRRRGLAVGLAFSGAGFGALLLIPLGGMIQALGWREACWAIAAVVLGLLGPLNLIAQRRRPEDLGLLPDGDTAPPISAGNPAKPLGGPTLGEALAMPAFWFMAIAAFGMLWVWYAVQVHQTQYLIDIGFSADMATLGLAAVATFGIAGQINGGWMADKIGRESAWTIGCLGFAVCYAILILMREAPSPLLFWAMIAVQGLFGYGLTAVFASAPADIFQGKNYSTIFGVLSVASSLGGGAGPYFTGLFHDIYGNYEIAFMVCIGWTAVSVSAIWIAAPRRARRRNLAAAA